VSTQVIPAGAVVAGRYRILARLGEGGMGAVYRATQEPLGREVALKVMAPSLTQDPGAVERFHREARASSALSHPNIVTVFDFGADEHGALYLAMELIPGKGLDGLLEQGALPWSRGITILRGICAALTEAHAKGIIHRDLKPANVIVTSTTTHEDVAKVVDFGIAKIKDLGSKSLTMTGAVVGTPGYVAPELFHGHEPSARGDLYAVGVMAFDIFCGRSPFKGNTAAELLKQHLFDAPPPPSSLMVGLPPALDALVLSLLEKDPQKRPASAKDVDRALAALEGSVVAVTPLAPQQATEMALHTPTPATRGDLSQSLAAPSSSSSLAPPPSQLMAPPPSHTLRYVALASVVAIVVVVGFVVVALARISERRHADRLAAQAPPPVTVTIPTPPPTPPTPPEPPPAPPPAEALEEPEQPEKPEKPEKPEEKRPRKKKLATTTTKTPPEPPEEPPPPSPPPPSTPQKRAFLGTVPDNGFAGPGVRVASVTPRSPAARAALGRGDILVRIDNDVVDGVPGLAIAMAHHQPGDRVRVTFTRAGVEHAVDLTLGEPPSAAPREERREQRRAPRHNNLDKTLRNVGKQIDRQLR
jgi:serine/threonine-protein kinase